MSDDQPRTSDGRFHFKSPHATQRRISGGMDSFIRRVPSPAEATPDPEADPAPVTGAGFDGGAHETPAPAETGSQRMDKAIRRGFGINE